MRKLLKSITLFIILFVGVIRGDSVQAQDCANIDLNPVVFHLFHPNPEVSTEFIRLYKQTAIGGDFVCPDTQCETDSFGLLHKITNISNLNNVDNIAYDNGSYYVIDNAGDLLFTDDIITANFTNLGNANIVNGAYKNLALDNGVFYHWQSSGSQIILYNSPNPVNSGWSNLGNVNGLSESVSEGGKTYQLRDIAVHEGVFYFYYYNTNACPSQSCNVDRTLVFSSSTPTNPTPSWQNHGSTYFGYGVRNIAIGSQDLKALAPPVQDLVIECPDETIDLAIAHTGTTPQGHSLRWFTNDTHSGLPLEANQVANTVEGEYYAFYFNISQNCYSPAAKVIVTKENCQNFCTSGDCNENAFLFTSDPNTLEYDNLVSGFHSSIAKQRDGNYLIWGQGAKPNTFGEHLYEPTLIIPENGFNYTGDILKATLGTRGYALDGSDQYAILTTDGLYIWGGNSTRDVMVHSSVKGTTTFDKMTDTNITNADPATGLPVGVAPTEVKMLFGSYATLGIVTCTGEAYVISHKGNKNGDGSTDGASEYNKWHRVSVGPDQPLNRIVAMRGVPGAMVALTYEGDVYTWGSETYLGDGSAKSNRLYATKMTLPAGVTPKMIGMTKAGSVSFPHRNNSYYLLSTTGEVYSLGDNSKKQLGTFDDIERTQWVNVKSTDASTNMTNIVWISPNEHDNAGHATVTALTADGKLWGWGMNHGNMLGEGNDAAVDPRYMFGGLDHNEKVLAIETGGHISTIFKDCEYKLGYIGHNVNGSYATYSDNVGTNSDVFKFDGAKLTNLCAIYTPPYPEVSNMRVCYGETADLTDAMLNSAPAGYTLEWWTTINRISGTEVADPTSVETGTYYAFFARDVDDCPQLEGQEVIVEQNPTTVLQQDVEDIIISVNNDYSYTVGTVSHPDPLPSGYSVQYTWEYATADNPTVWNVLDNTTFPGEITLTGSTFSISHATKDIDGIKVRVTAQTVYESPLSPEVIGPVDCTTQSNEFLITIKAGAVVTNPMLLNRAK